MSVMISLASIPYWREHGTEKYVRDEEDRYICPECGHKLFRGAKRCNKCKVAVDLDWSLLNEDLFNLKPVKFDICKSIAVLDVGNIGKRSQVSASSVITVSIQYRKYKQMPYNEELEARIKKFVSRWKGTDDKKMFGGVCHLLNGNMFCGIYKEFLIHVRRWRLQKWWWIEILVSWG